jgi:phosphatidate cytidylyltransferase
VPSDVIVDPRSVPGAGYVVGSLAILAGVSFVAVGSFAVARRGGAAPRTLLSRWLTWLVIAAVWALACLSGPLPVSLLMTAFALVGLREFGRLTELPGSHRTLLAIGAVIAGGLALAGAAALLAMIPLLLLVGIVQPVVAADVRQGIRHLAFGALGFGYLPLLLGHGTLIVRDVERGGTVLFVLGVAVALSDIGAYVAGRTFGRHPLAPLLSPNKTVEGLAGNLAGAALGLLLFAPVLPSMPPAVLVALPPLVAIGAVWGDLFESALKREFGTKDAGSWLPGFGGLLDRIDSLILVLPLAYYGLRAAGLAEP